MIDYVYYDNTDCGNIVYHTNYIMFCERARSLIFYKKNMLPNANNSEFVVKSLESDFISPLKLGDRYEVRSKVLDIKNTSMTIKQEIYKIGEIGNSLELNELCFSMVIKMVFIDIDAKKPMKIPNDVMDVLREHM